MTPPTQFEREILDRVIAGLDPWDGAKSNTRAVSQALGRLIRKGILRRGHNDRCSYVITDAGIDVIAGPAQPDPPCKCGAPSVWHYMPASEGRVDRDYCEACVPRGCSCQLIDDEPEATEQYRDEDGRLLPCCEYMRFGKEEEPTTDLETSP